MFKEIKSYSEFKVNETITLDGKTFTIIGILNSKQGLTTYLVV